MKKLLILLLLWPAAAFAQRPGAVTTFTLTDTTSDALHVGCAVGSSTCTGGIKSGPIDVSTIISAGAISIASNVPGVTTNKLYNNGGTLTWNGSAVAIGGAVGPGNSGKLAKFTGANSIGDSICTESGTTITCVNTVSATTLTGTLSTASQTAITGVGTITTGTWNATKIGLLYGGTNLDMTATGGTSQFLKQNSLGGAITVVRPAISDLSDGTNVALLNAANTFSVAGTQTVTRTNAGTPLEVKTAETSAIGTSVGLVINDNGARNANDIYQIGFGALSTNQPMAVVGHIVTTSTSFGKGSLFFATRDVTTDTAPTVRWGINSAGDLTFGASSHIALSSGTPAINSGFGAGATITGQDYGIIVTTGTGSPTSGLIDFGHTHSLIPSCTASSSTTTSVISVSSSTTQVLMNFSAALASGIKIYVNCHGF